MDHSIYINRCIELAKLGFGHTYPNPMVGAVIVHHGKIIGEGYHMKYGGPHAEVNAVNSVDNLSILKESTIYVSLEPCSHFGKTPPCSDLIIHHQFKKVVVGSQDPFEKVNGAGVNRMRAAGIEVEMYSNDTPLLDLNKRFFTFHTKKRPYIILKWAQSSDGFMDRERSEDDLGVNWITHKDTKVLTHQWRAEEDAILVGGNTILTDEPSLTVRHTEGNNPKRIILDAKGGMTFPKTWKVDTEKDFIIGQVTKSSFKCELTASSITKMLYELNIQSVIIEGGRKTLDLFIQSGIWDEARILTGTPLFNHGNSAPKVSGNIKEEFYFSDDKIQIILNDGFNS